jgi:Putative prokaryotic signal transducing protein
MAFVVIAAYDNYVPAHIALGRLKEEYINCYLQDEYTVTIDPLLAGAVGGIKLMVEQTQAERAVEILNNVTQ